MRQSELFTKTRREAPKDEVSQNAQLLIRGGFVHKEMAGVYSFLPLGLRVFNNIIEIIREEMNAIGGQEVLLSTLQDPEIWKKTNRWDDKANDVWFKTHLHSGETFHQGTELGIANTHEEPLTNLLREYIDSYRELPRYIYQFQTKFRNELRAKSGLMRTREFVMKDLYSFCRTTEEHEKFYKKAAGAYMKIFKRCGIGDSTFQTFASGGSFSKFSHEFQTLSPAGEDIIYLSKERNLAINKEVYTPGVLKELGLSKDELKEEKAIEVGNIFSLGTRFSDALGLFYRDERGEKKSVVMGSYGIGPGRLMGTIVETHSDEKGIIWPKSVAPFSIHLVELSSGEDKVKHAAEELYKKLIAKGIEVLYADHDAQPGEKFADADLLGIPYRVVVSEQTMQEGKYELKERRGEKTRMVDEKELFSL